ncbi:MAG TPA: hypothetical protein VN030_13475 [Cellvibrio sp.]|nr:hypothetical protein [Cellvibrio sp.]
MKQIRVAVIGLCAVTALTGCEVADYRHAKVSLTQGDIQGGLAEMTILADRGVPEAQLVVGDLIVDTDPVQAEKYYLEAEQRGEFKANGRLAKLYSMRAENFNEVDAQKSLEHIRKAIAIGDDSVLSNLVELAVAFPALGLESEAQEAIDKYKRVGSTNAQYSEVVWWQAQGLTEQHADAIEATCLKLIDIETGCFQALINIYQIKNQPADVEKTVDRAITNYNKKLMTPASVVTLVRWMSNPDRKAPLTNESLKLLEMVSPNWSPANFEIAKILYNNPSLQRSQQLDDILKKEHEQGNWRATEMQAQIIYFGKNRVPDPKNALPLLLSIKDKSPVANYLLGIIYRDAILSDADPSSALEHLLIAARFGYLKGDLALAQMFSQAKGTIPNPVYAYSFASLAAANGSTSVQQLQTDIAAGMSSADKAAAEKLFLQEQNARLALKRDHAICCVTTLNTTP